MLLGGLLKESSLQVSSAMMNSDDEDFYAFSDGRNVRSRDPHGVDSRRGIHTRDNGDPRDRQGSYRRNYDGADRARDGRGPGRGRGNDEEGPPPLYSIHQGTVHSVRPFGFFVRLPGYRRHGLVHISQVSEHEVSRRYSVS